MTKDQQIAGLKTRVETQEKLIEEIKKNEANLLARVNVLVNDNSRLVLEARWLRENFQRLLEAITS